MCVARESLKFGFISPTDGPYGYRNISGSDDNGDRQGEERRTLEGRGRHVSVAFISYF